MHSKKMYSRIAEILLVLLLVAVGFGALTYVTMRKHAYYRYDEFMEHRDEIDVWFLGSSHMLYGVNPVTIYENYGITSYNLSKEGGMIPENYWMIRNALDYGTPQCIVLDLWAMDRDFQYLDEPGEPYSEEAIRDFLSGWHNQMDFWPMSATKRAAIQDLLHGFTAKTEFAWPFVLYHDRWDELQGNDFKFTRDSRLHLMGLGSDALPEVMREPMIYQDEDATQVLEKETVGAAYLRKTIELCQEKDIDIVLTFLPMANSYASDRKVVNTAAAIAQEYGVDFINLLPHEGDTVVDFRTDMWDDTHVNSGGMYKLSMYLGQYLAEHTDVRDRRSELDGSFWERRTAEYRESLVKELTETDDLHTLLNRLRYTDMNVCVYIRQDSPALRDPVAVALLQDLTGTNGILSAKNENGPYLLYRDRTVTGTGDIIHYEFAGNVQTDPFLTMQGETSYIGLPDFAALYVNEDYENNYLDMDRHRLDDVQVILMTPTGEVVATKYFRVGMTAS